MKVWRSGLIAFGMTTAYLFRLVEPLVDSKHLEIYHWSGSPAALFLPALLDVLLVWAITTFALLLAEWHQASRFVVWIVLLTPFPWLVMKNLAAHFPGTVSQGVCSVVLYASGALGLFLIAFGRRFADKSVNCVIEVASVSFLFGAMGGSLLLLEMGWFCFKAHELNPSSELSVRSVQRVDTHPAHGRVIWIIFDELSYQQIFERRFPGLLLPAFDALTAQSTVFTHVKPAGIYTERIVPALMSGSPVEAIRSTPTGQLLTLASGQASWSAFNPRDTIFADALQNGYRTAVAGWFNPYCRLLHSVLERCTWTYTAERGTAFGHSLLVNMLQPFTGVIGTDSILHPLTSLLQAPDEMDAEGRNHLADYTYLVAASSRLLADPSVDFVFLHLPVPHPNGIYDRQTGRFATRKSTYIDNLALADACLGRIERVLQESGQWNSSSIVVMGDHGWRTTLLWKDGREWTEEEQSASDGGRFDERPAYLVKLPNQQHSSQLTSPFPALRTRSLLQAILQGRVDSSHDLQLWAQERSNGS